jgi:hypothetical protein
MAKKAMPETAKDPRVRALLGVDELPPEFATRPYDRATPGPQDEASVDYAGLLIFPGPRTTDEDSSGCPGYI